MSYLERLSEKNENLRDELDDIVNDVCEVILDIAEKMHVDRYCPCCEETAKSLFRIIEEHGDENAVTDMLEQFAHKTGIGLNDD